MALLCCFDSHLLTHITAASHHHGAKTTLYSSTCKNERAEENTVIGNKEVNREVTYFVHIAFIV
jgi:hypothetical protein